MSKAKRIQSVLTGLMMILGALVMIAWPDKGYLLVAAILSISLFASGIRALVYYFSMARHMVGGKNILYKAVILLDLGAFVMTMTTYPRAYVILYMIVAHAFSGVLDILHALDNKKTGDPKWKRGAALGAANLIVALAAGVAGFAFHSTDIVVYIYCLCLLVTAITRVVSAFKRTAIVYIQ